MPPIKKPPRLRRGHAFKEWRLSKKPRPSQAAIAEALGMSSQNYGRIENGALPYDQDIIEMLADFYQCFPEDLLKPPGERPLDALVADADPATREKARAIIAALVRPVR